MEKKRVGVPDFVLLSDISEDNFIDNLVKRAKEDEIYTYIGEVIVAMNPYKTLQFYTDKFVQQYKGRYLYENPPHIYALGDDVVRALMQTHNNQCIVISGESGAGKTESAKFILSYIAAITPATKSTSVGHVKEKLLESNPVLEAFGNAKTLRNDNSSRFGKYMEIQFDYGGAPVGGRITNYLLEKSRVVKRLTGERTFHIFYQMLKGVDDTQLTQLQLSRNADDYAYLASSQCSTVSTIDDKADYKHVMKAFNVFGLSQTETADIFKVLAAILHIGNINLVVDESVQQAGAAAIKVANPDVANTVATLLGLDPTQLIKALTFRTLVTGTKETVTNLDVSQGTYARDAMTKSMYQKLFRWLVQRLNSGVESPKEVSQMTIGILDIYGFEVFKENGFEQFCINYVNESLQQLFIELILKAEQEEYYAEGIEWEDIKYFNNQVIVDMIEQKGGIIALLDDTCAMESEATDSNFVAKLDKTLGEHDHYSTYKTKKDRSIADGTFVIKHYAGSVTYNMEGFVDKNRDQLFRDIIRTLCASSNVLVKQIFPPELATESSNKRPPTTGFQFREAVKSLMISLRACQPHYVRCIKPNGDKKPNSYDDELLRHQVRYLGLIENVRVRRAGFANRQPYERFLHRYKMLGGKKTWPKFAGQPRDAVNLILEINGVEKGASAAWQEVTRFGKTKLFIRNPETLFHYEELRDARLPWVVTQMQKVWRGHLGRVKAKRHRSARTIQKRVRGMLQRAKYRILVAVVLIQRHLRASQARLLTKQSEAAKYLQKIARGYRYRHNWLKLKSAIKIQRFQRIYMARWKLKCAIRIQKFVRIYMARKCLYRMQKTWAKAKDENKGVIRYGKKFEFPRFPSIFKYSEAMFKRLQFRYWVVKMVKSLDAEQTRKMKQKIRTSDLFKGKKVWSVKRDFKATYLAGDAQLTAALARPPFNNPKVVFSTTSLKVNRKGQSQPRLIIFTDQGIWKIDGNGYKPKKVITPYESVVGITLSPHKDNFVVIHCKEPIRDLVLDIPAESDGEKITELAVVLEEVVKAKTGKAINVSVSEKIEYNNTRKPGQPSSAGNATLIYEFVSDPKIVRPTFVKAKTANAPNSIQAPK